MTTPRIYEASELREIAALMDDVSKHDGNLRVEGEAFLIERYQTSGPGPDDGERWETTIEFVTIPEPSSLPPEATP